MSLLVINDSESDILIKSSICSLSINGNNNRIVIISSVPMLIINGNNNAIKATSFPNLLCDIVINSNDNKVKIAKSSFINTIDNGTRNLLLSNRKICLVPHTPTQKVNDKENHDQMNIKITFTTVNINELQEMFTSKKRKRSQLL